MPIIQKYVDDMVTVTDNEIAESILLLLERNKMVVEPAGAAALAAVLNHKLDLKGKRDGLRSVRWKYRCGIHS